MHAQSCKERPTNVNNNDASLLLTFQIFHQQLQTRPNFNSQPSISFYNRSSIDRRYFHFFCKSVSWHLTYVTWQDTTWKKEILSAIRETTLFSMLYIERLQEWEGHDHGSWIIVNELCIFTAFHLIQPLTEEDSRQLLIGKSFF